LGSPLSARVCAGLRRRRRRRPKLPSQKKKEKEKKGKRSATANGDPGSFYSAATSMLVGGTEKKGWLVAIRSATLSPPFAVLIPGW